MTDSKRHAAGITTFLKRPIEESSFNRASYTQQTQTLISNITHKNSKTDLWSVDVSCLETARDKCTSNKEETRENSSIRNTAIINLAFLIFTIINILYIRSIYSNITYFINLGHLKKFSVTSI